MSRSGRSPSHLEADDRAFSAALLAIAAVALLVVLAGLAGCKRVHDSGDSSPSWAYRYTCHVDRTCSDGRAAFDEAVCARDDAAAYAPLSTACLDADCQCLITCKRHDLAICLEPVDAGAGDAS